MLPYMRGYRMLLIQDSEDPPVEPLALMARAMPASFSIKVLILESGGFAKHNQHRPDFTVESPCSSWYKANFCLSFYILVCIDLDYFPFHVP